MRLDKIQEAIGWFFKRRIFTNCFYMLGFPTETPEEMEQTIKFACSQPSHTALFFIATPFNGTELADQAAEIGVNVHKNFEKYTYHTTNLNISGNIPTKVLHRAAKFAYFRFLLANPKRLYRIFRDHPNKPYLWQIGWMVVHRTFFDNLNNIDLIENVRHVLGLKTYKQIKDEKSKIVAHS